MNEKRLLAILGSPHKKGTTAAMLDYTVEAAKKAGWTVDFIDLYEKKIGFCTGCRTCLTTGTCIQQDDVQEISELLKKCSVVALASPVYWANVPAVVKNMFDRLLGTVMEETNTFPKARLSKNQKYILLTACHTPYPFSWIFGQSRGAVRAMAEFFRTAGMTSGGSYVCTNTGKKKNLPKSFMKAIEFH